MTLLPQRPYPPAALFDEDVEGAFARAEDVEEWLRKHFIEPDGVFFSETHESLQDASLGVLWTTAENSKQGVVVAGTAEMPSRSGGRMSGWAKEMWKWQMRRWFGPRLPVYVITFNATVCAEMEDVEFLATAKHELLHCGQATYDGKRDGDLWFKQDGSRVWTIWPHDFEGFVEVAEDFGAVERGVGDLAKVLRMPPRFGTAEIKIACGTVWSRAA